MSPSLLGSVSYKPQRITFNPRDPPPTLLALWQVGYQREEGRREKRVEGFSFWAFLTATGWQPQFMADVIKPLQIEQMLDYEVSSLGGGELQRISLALALRKPANLYLLNEPSLNCLYKLHNKTYLTLMARRGLRLLLWLNLGVTDEHLGRRSSPRRSRSTCF
jgi:ABC-type Mn2+/Zn2+ transport system ATPase subunit